MKFYNFNVKNAKDIKFISVYFYLRNNFYIKNIKVFKRLFELLIYFESNKIKEFISGVYYLLKIFSKEDSLFTLISREKLINSNLI